MLGSSLRDASSRISARRLPKGGIREQERLEVVEGAIPDPTFASTNKRGFAGRLLRIVAIVSALLIVLLVIVALSTAMLSTTSAFAVENIETYDTEHLLADEVARLADVGDDVTLLNLDAKAIQEGVMRNPWVSSVDVERVFPDTLRIRVYERTPGAVVAMGSGGKAWLLGSDNVWIEPLKLEVDISESSNDVALAEAAALGVILIADVPSEVYPVAGSACTDGCIEAVMSVAGQFSDAFRQRVVCYSVSSEDDISCTLDNGVEISLGSAGSIDVKEAVAARVLEEYEGQITYINVRTPSRPTYRRVESEYVTGGTGATGVSLEEKSIVPKVRASDEEDEDAEDGENEEGADSAEQDDGYGDYAEESGYADEGGYAEEY